MRSKNENIGFTNNWGGDYVDKMANYFASKGHGTGGISKILSGVSFLVLTFLCAHLFSDKQYIPLIILVLLSWNRFGYVVVAGIMVYFIIVAYWMGIISVVIYYIIGPISMVIGKRNIKRLILEGKPIIDPFEGMAFIILNLILQCIFLFGALLTHGIIAIILWALFGIVTIFQCQTYAYRLFPKWRSIHYPLMIRYAAAAARETVDSSMEHRQYDFLKATQLLLQTVYTNTETRHIEVTSRAYDKMRTFSDRQALIEYIVKKNPSVDIAELNNAFEKTKTNLNAIAGQKAIIEYGIAEVIEDVYGSEERIKYLWAYFTGEVR